MQQVLSKRIFAKTEPADFVGRRAELDRLLKHADGKSGANGLAVLSVPSAGTSELLRQTYDRLFAEQDEISPVYFELKTSDGSAENAARRFLYEFLLQTAAFRRRDATLIDLSPALNEVADLAAPSYGHWIDRLAETYHGDANDQLAFIRNCLAAPLRAAAHDIRSFVMIDNLSAAVHLEQGESFLELLTAVFARSTIPFTFAGHRRFLFARTPFQALPVEPLSFADAGEMAARLSAKTGVKINDQTRDLIAVQLGGKPVLIDYLFHAASSREVDLDSFELVEKTYTDEIFGGAMARYLDATLDRILPDAVQRGNFLRLASERIVPTLSLKKQLRITNHELRILLDALNWNEFINVSSGVVQIDKSDSVVCDYLKGRNQLELDTKPRALIVGEALTENIRRAPELMARLYRKNAAIGLRELLLKFDGRKISAAALDYEKFKTEFKGADDDKILKAFKEDNAKINLPSVVYTAHTGDFYAKLNEMCDIERSAVALGFVNAGRKEESVWIAAEIESKLEATAELTEDWCDRLAKAAISCNFSRFNIWLVAPEGFSAEAMEVLRTRNALGSSRKQVELLARLLGAEIRSFAANAANEYEFVFPMGENTEMIVAYTVEEIAKRHAVPSKAINQIKTALVEACINAAEHSLSPDRKIYQRIVIDDEKITIIISNRGLRLADKATKEIAPDEGRRGWGLKLMKGLMDEVTIEQVDDGTRVTMVKNLKQA